MKSAFLIKIQVKVFYIQIWFKCETPLLFFSNKTMVYRKKDLDYVKIIELHVVHTWLHMQSEQMK